MKRCSPPFVDANVRTSGEPRVQNEHATKGGSSHETLPQRGIVVQSETLAKPMNRVLPALAVQRHFRVYFTTATTRHLHFLLARLAFFQSLPPLLLILSSVLSLPLLHHFPFNTILMFDRTNNTFSNHQIVFPLMFVFPAVLRHCFVYARTHTRARARLHSCTHTSAKTHLLRRFSIFLTTLFFLFVPNLYSSITSVSFSTTYVSLFLSLFQKKDNSEDVL